MNNVLAFSAARVTDLKEVEAILDIFQAHGHYEVRVFINFIILRFKGLIVDTTRSTRRAYTPTVRARSTSARLTGRNAGSLWTRSSTPRFAGYVPRFPLSSVHGDVLMEPRRLRHLQAICAWTL